VMPDRLRVSPISANLIHVEVEGGPSIEIMGTSQRIRISAAAPYAEQRPRTGPLHYQEEDLTLPLNTNYEEHQVSGSILIVLPE